MKYVALLRGINVGGKSLIKMADLKKCVENAGFENVLTYINSGNVIFESVEKNELSIASLVEDSISKILKKETKAVVVSSEDLNKIIFNIPNEWKNKNDLRCYLAFVRLPIKPEDVLKEVKINNNVDSVKLGPRVLYMTTKLSGITKSGFSRLVTKKIYQEITIRNFNTIIKLSELLKK